MYTENTKAEVARLFFEVNKNFKHCMRKNFGIGGLTIPQTLVVFTLFKSGEMKISELSKKVNLSNSTVSGIVDRLEKQGMVERTRSEEDRRTVFVSVTEKFKEVHKGFHKEIEKNFEDSLSSGTPEELEKVIEGLNILKRILNGKER
ncbi:MarR family transcriptional regulator [Clostridium sp. JN-9]|uniref:MarR family transcriptional regulator n=1 Tax=Clostridium sp. JN-9 TaxID=2507159 RepID=UPI001FAA3F67|nr:MarR family transcriptional regulator [Clostridium sp. JN-9]